MIGVVWGAALLLAVAGVGKLLRPTPTSRAVRAAELPGAQVFSALPVVRSLGAAELGIATWVLLGGGQLPAALLGVAYLLLTVVAWRMLRRAPGQDCGCFGSESEPISRIHVIVNGVGALVGICAAVWPSAFPLPSVPDELTRNGWQGALVLTLASLLAWLCYLLMTALPALLALRAKVTAAR